MGLPHDGLACIELIEHHSNLAEPTQMMYVTPYTAALWSADQMTMEEKKSEELNWYAAWMAVGICILSCNYKFVMLKNRMC